MEEYPDANADHGDAHHREHCWPVQEGPRKGTGVHPSLTTADVAPCRGWRHHWHSFADLQANITWLHPIGYCRAHAAGNTEDNMTFAKMPVNLLLDQIDVSIVPSLASVVFRGKACLISRVSPCVESHLREATVGTLERIFKIN